MQIIDDFEFRKDTTNSLWDISQVIDLAKPRIEDAKVQALVDELTTKYVNDKESLTFNERKYILSQYIPSVNTNYEGILKIKIVDPFTVIERNVNEDIDYYSYAIKRSKSLDKLLSTVVTEKDRDSVLQKARNIGYSESTLFLHTLSSLNDDIEVDTDPYNDIGTYIVSLERTEDKDIDNSLLNRIIEPLINSINAQRKQRELVGLASKVTRIVKAPGLSDDQMEALDAQFTAAAESAEGYVVTVNYDVSVEDLSLDARESLDLQNIIDTDTKDVTSSLGMTESLLGGEDSYGNSFMKIELLVNEYTAFRAVLKDFIENKIFKPIAYKMGFVTRDEWGNVTPIFPEVSFDRLSIARSSEDFKMLMDLAKEGKLPWENIYSALGFNVDDVQVKLLQEKTSIISDSVSNALNSAVEAQADSLAESKDIQDRVKDALFVSDDTNLEPSDESIDTEASGEPQEPLPVKKFSVMYDLSTPTRLALIARVNQILKDRGLKVRIPENKQLVVESFKARGSDTIQVKEGTLKGVNNYINSSCKIWRDPNDRLVLDFNSKWLSERYKYLMAKYKLTDASLVFKPRIVLIDKLNIPFVPVDIKVNLVMNKEFIRA